MVDYGELAFKFLLWNFEKFDWNQTFPVFQTNAVETSYLPAVNMAHGGRCYQQQCLNCTEIKQVLSNSDNVRNEINKLST